MNWSLRSKIIYITVVILSLAIGANTLTSNYVLTREYSDVLQSRAFAIGHSLKMQLDRLLGLGIPLDNLVGFEKQCQAIIDIYEDIAYAMVVNVDGKILFHNDPAQQNQVLTDPETLESLKSSKDVIHLYFEDGETYYDVIIPVFAPDGEHIGAVRIGFPARLVTQKTGGLIAYSAGVAAISLVFATALVIFALSVWVTQPLMKLVSVIQEIIREGTESAREVNIDSRDEIGQLASAFNRMIGDLKESHQKIKEYTQELELKVEERTVELKQINQQLQRDIAERTSAEEALHSKTHQQAQLLETARHLTTSLDTRQVLARIASGAKEILETFGCAIYLLEPDGQTLTPVVVIEPGYEEEILAFPLHVESSLTGQAVKARSGLIFNDTQNNADAQQIPGTPVEEDERVIAVPFIVEDKILGAMCLDRVGTLFTEEDLAVAEAFATYAATALKNAQTHAELRREVEERQRAEEQIKASLKEKEVLLQEIHHRVKNNLQVISSLLRLQSAYLQDQQTLDIFRDSENRVRSMALIHEKLYRSTDLAQIDFGDYIRELTAFLFRSQNASSRGITLDIQTDPVYLHVEAAVPSGLILNELITNALKHAFPDGQAGEIGIKLWTSDDGQVNLMVADNGRGLPPGLDLRATGSLGLQLVNSLVGQLDGTLNVNGTRGTEFKISFAPF